MIWWCRSADPRGYSDWRLTWPPNNVNKRTAQPWFYFQRTVYVRNDRSSLSEQRNKFRTVRKNAGRLAADVRNLFRKSTQNGRFDDYVWGLYDSLLFKTANYCLPHGLEKTMQFYTVSQKKTGPFVILSHLCFDRYELHENVQKYTGVIAWCECGVNVCDTLTILC